MSTHSTPSCSDTMASQESDFGTKYSQIIDYIDTAQECELKESFKRLNQICSVMDNTFSETKTTSDYLQDMNALARTTSAAKNLAKNVNSKMRSFNPVDFAHRLLEKYQNERGIMDLSRLVKYGDAIIKRTGFNPIVLNTFVPTVTEIEQKKRTVTRREKDKVAEKKMSEKVTSIEKADPTITEIVSKIEKRLALNYKRNGKRPISFFHFTLDPTSYTRSIENIFHTSFMFRDNRAKMSINPGDGLPTIMPFIGPKGGKENEGEDGEGGSERDGVTRHQMVVALTPAQHEELVQLLNIETAMIPPSTSSSSETQSTVVPPVPLRTVIQKRQAVNNSTNIEHNNKHKKL
uniref:Non-structural maintenance of chromosomes element 4 n=1 Tax=Cacopsylla melanoneura TaxID=428564 RepID=A0A8D8PR24_9HEMI